MTEEQTVVAFGRKVRDLRQGKGITLEQFALGLGIDPKHMGRIEQGKANPTLRVMVRIAEALSVPFSTLLSE